MQWRNWKRYVSKICENMCVWGISNQFSKGLPSIIFCSARMTKGEERFGNFCSAKKDVNSSENLNVWRLKYSISDGNFIIKPDNYLLAYKRIRILCANVQRFVLLNEAVTPTNTQFYKWLIDYEDLFQKTFPKMKIFSTVSRSDSGTFLFDT